MTSSPAKRDRGRLLTDQGLEKIWEALHNQFPDGYTLQAIADFTNPTFHPKRTQVVSVDTISKILKQEGGADLSKIKILFAAFGLNLEESDHRSAKAEKSPCPISPVNPKSPEYQKGIWIPNLRCRQVWGRDDFRETLLNRLNYSQESILSLCGSAGYGKTEVACQVARAAIEQGGFVDVLWVKARDTEFVDGSISQPEREEAVSWQQVSQELAHQLNGCSTERLHQFMKAEKRLIVLDNAETAQLEEILPKLNAMLNPSRLLLTSRFQTNVAYVGLVDIPPLDNEYARQLLQCEAEYKKVPALLQALETNSAQLQKIYELSCGAPLALHFIVGRILDDGALEPVLSALEQASGDVEKIYEFSLKTAWQRIKKVTKKILGYMGDADAGVTWEELSGAGLVQVADWTIAQRELKRWYLIEETTDSKGQKRYNVHPWVRRSLRGGLVGGWERSLQEWEEMAMWKYNLGSLGGLNILDT
jgi:Mrp family chromosome partitioning ATPase